jgi:hypothetical protein
MTWVWGAPMGSRCRQGSCTSASEAPPSALPDHSGTQPGIGRRCPRRIFATCAVGRGASARRALWGPHPQPFPPVWGEGGRARWAAWMSEPDRVRFPSCPAARGGRGRARVGPRAGCIGAARRLFPTLRFESAGCLQLSGLGCQPEAHRARLEPLTVVVIAHQCAKGR